MRLIFKNFIFTLKRYRTSSLLNIIGLAVAFASLYIILVQVHYDLTYNRAIKDCERVYRLEHVSWYSTGKYMCWLNRPFSEQIIRTVSGVEAGGTAYSGGQESDVCTNQNGALVEYVVRASQMSMPIIDVLGFEAVQGTFSNLENPNSVIISESAAKKLNLSVGDVMYQGSKPDSANAATVVAIFKNFAQNVDWSQVEVFANIGERSINDQSEWSYNYFIKLNSANDTAAFNRQVADMVKKYLVESGVDPNTDEYKQELKRGGYRILPLSQTYFSPDSENAPGRVGNRTTTYTLFGIAILIVLIALINFINFFFAMVPIRIRSVNTYKIFGSSLASIRLNFIFESIGLTVIALLLAYVLVLCVQTSSIANLISATITLSENCLVLCVTVISAFTFAFLGSVYPSFYITSFSPAMVIKGSFASTKAGQYLRYTLIGLQFTISIALIICAMFIRLQHGYMMRYDMGFNKENLLTVDVPYKIPSQLNTRDAFTAKLLQNPQIKDAAWAAGAMVAESRMGWGRNFKGKTINFQCYPVSWNFLRFMGIHVEEGRDFSESDEVKENGTFIFNEYAKNSFNLLLEDLMPGHAGETSIAGFCKDFNFKPLQYGISPLAFYIFGSNAWWRPSHLYFRTTSNADIPAVITYVKQCIAEFSPQSNVAKIDIRFFDEELQRNYDKEQRLTSLVTIFTLISVIISLMGVFGLVMFETQYRRKEIGIRRVHGATVGEILAMFNTRFIRIVLICFVIATPISYYIIDRWMGSFTYRSPLHWWVFATALLAILIITVATVTLRSLHAATENPAHSIVSD